MKYDDMEKLAIEYMDEGKQTFFDNKLEQAALLVQNALHLLKKAGSLELYANALNLMGVIYAATGNETMAVDYYLEGLECAIDNHFDNIAPIFYNNIGTRYQELNEHEKALSYFKKAVRALENPACRKEDRYASWCLVTAINIMMSCRELGQYEMAVEYLKMAECFMQGETAAIHKYTFLISKCRLYWNMGEKPANKKSSVF